MAKEKFPATRAIRQLKESGVDFSLYLYKFKEQGGTTVAAKELNVDEHQVIKTLVMEADNGDPLLILMHGNKKVSTKALARALGVKTVKPCDPQIAHKHTGYFVGGTSPFGTRKSLKVYLEASIMELPTIYINAGKKGLLAKMSPGDLKKLLTLTPVSVAI
ncbi:MAG: Cys-tRNA(Pro) deacylase [Thermodesulfobacteriota bacterium]